MKQIILAGLLVSLAVGAGSTPVAADVVPTTLHSFDEDDGRQPTGALIDGHDGYLYGTTSLGGNGVPNPAGTIFRMTYAGDLTSLYAFEFQVTGDRPFARLLRAANGTLFGTTRGSSSFRGNVFGLTTLGSFASLHTFTGHFVGADGGHPEGGLAAGGDGNLYGLTTDGGASNVGTLYRIAANGTYTLLHSFSGGLGPQDGGSPRGELVLEGGHLYGVTNALGPTQPTAANGTVFRFTPGASGVTTLHAFRGIDGAGPNSTLVKALDGAFYGTTASGGAHNAGTVFRIRTNGDFATVHAFDSSAGDGTNPVGLAAGSDGNLYGVSSSGGANYLGTVFRVEPDGGFETLFSFSALNGGGYSAQGPLVQADDGDFYGTTNQGGTGFGTVYKIAGDDILVPEPGAAATAVAAVSGLGITALVRRRRPIHIAS